MKNPTVHFAWAVFFSLRERFMNQTRKGEQEMEKLLFTSESVTEGHPDKMCDQISDAILDALMEQDPMSRVACETCVTTGIVMVMGEITTKAYVDIQKIVRDTVREIGYTRGKYGFDADTCGVRTFRKKRSGSPVGEAGPRRCTDEIFINSRRISCGIRLIYVCLLYTSDAADE